jgi:hypothetical protein
MLATELGASVGQGRAGQGRAGQTIAHQHNSEMMSERKAQCAWAPAEGIKGPSRIMNTLAAAADMR